MSAAVALAVLAASALVATAHPVSAATRWVRIHALLPANDDGSKAATITPNQIAIMVADANDIFAGSGIAFQFDPAVDVDRPNSTALNNDCVPEFVVVYECDQAQTGDAVTTYAYAPARQHKLVVRFRYGSTELVCEVFVCSNARAKGASSSHRGSVVNMPNYNTSGRLLAHEIGHYLWNPHTFSGRSPSTLDEAKQMIKSYVEAGNSKANGLNVFDGDRGWGTTDTAPDPRGTLWAALKGDACATGSGSDTHTFSVTFSDSSTYSYTLAPPRDNIMSYYACPGIAQHLSPDQQQFARDAIDLKNRGAQVGKLPAWVNPEEFNGDSLPGGPYQIVASFTMDFRGYLFAYKGTGAYRVFRIADSGGDGLFEVGTGTIAAGFTTLMPYHLNGVPHILAYNKSSGKVNFLALNSVAEPTVEWSWTWGTGWTSIMPFVQNGQSHFIIYNAATGLVQFNRFNSNGQGYTGRWSSTWSTGWSSFVPFVKDGQPHFIVYKKTTGAVSFNKIAADAQGHVSLGAHTWGTGWTHMVPFTRGEQQRYLKYNAGTGQIHIDRVSTDGTQWATIHNGNVGAGRETVVSVKHFGGWFVHAYDNAGGSATLRYMHQ